MYTNIVQVLYTHTHTHIIFRHLFLYSCLFPDLQCCRLCWSIHHTLALGKIVQFPYSIPVSLSWMLVFMTRAFYTHTHIIAWQPSLHPVSVLFTSPGTDPVISILQCSSDWEASSHSCRLQQRCLPCCLQHYTRPHQWILWLTSNDIWTTVSV